MRNKTKTKKVNNPSFPCWFSWEWSFLLIDKQWNSRMINLISDQLFSQTCLTNRLLLARIYITTSLQVPLKWNKNWAMISREIPGFNPLWTSQMLIGTKYYSKIFWNKNLCLMILLTQNLKKSTKVPVTDLWNLRRACKIQNLR